MFVFRGLLVPAPAARALCSGALKVGQAAQAHSGQAARVGGGGAEMTENQAAARDWSDPAGIPEVLRLRHEISIFMQM